MEWVSGAFERMGVGNWCGRMHLFPEFQKREEKTRTLKTAGCGTRSYAGFLSWIVPNGMLAQ